MERKPFTWRLRITLTCGGPRTALIATRVGRRGRRPVRPRPEPTSRGVLRMGPGGRRLLTVGGER